MKQSKLLVFWAFLFSMIIPLLGNAQDSLTTEQRIALIESQVDFSNLDSAWNKNTTVSVYFRNSFLRISEELNYQINLLSTYETGQEEEDIFKPRNKKILDHYVVSEGRMSAWMMELNQLAEKGKLGGNKLASPFSLVSDWELRSYHHSLLKAYAANNGFPSTKAIPVKESFESILSKIETELQSRQLLVKSNPNAVAVPYEKVALRFKLVEELNRLAQQEALHLVDNSPMLLDDREKIIELVKRIRGIDRQFGIEDNKLPVARTLLTESTMNFRFEILEHGLKQLETKNHLTRHYDYDIDLRLKIIGEELSIQKQWVYVQKRHAVIANGISTRGPPTDIPPSENFQDEIFPKSPKPNGGNGGLTLQSLLDDSQVEKTAKASKKAYQTATRRMAERFQALNLDIPAWEQARSSNYRLISLNNGGTGIGPYFKHLSGTYAINLFMNPAEAELNKAEFEIAVVKLTKEAGVTEDVKITDFLISNRSLLNHVEEGLISGIQLREERIAKGKGIYEPWLQNEVVNLQNTLENIRISKKDAEARMTISDPLKWKGSFDRPPPPVEKLFQLDPQTFQKIISNEEFAKLVCQNQIMALEKVRAIYGMDAPPSIGARQENLKAVLTTNEAASALFVFRDYAKYMNDVRALDSWIAGSEYSDKFKMVVNELLNGEIDYEKVKENESALRLKLDKLSKDISNPRYKSKVSDRIHYDINNAREVLPMSNKAPSKVEVKNWRPSQDLVELNETSLTKSPGGIWLSPEGLVFPKLILPELEWNILPIGKSCHISEDDQFRSKMDAVVEEWKNPVEEDSFEEENDIDGQLENQAENHTEKDSSVVLIEETGEQDSLEWGDQMEDYIEEDSLSEETYIEEEWESDFYERDIEQERLANEEWEEWILNEEEKICFSKRKSPILTHHWLKQYESWFYEKFN